MEMQGSIAIDLYSEILQSSSVELERGISAAQPNGISREGGMGDDSWYDDEFSQEDFVKELNKASDMDREWQKRRTEFHTIGYRDGVIAGQEAAAQEGFNIGFKDYVVSGYNWGLVRGITSAMACLPGCVKEKLIETEETRNKFQSLYESARSLSTAEALKLFHQAQKETAKPTSSRPDDNYQGRAVSFLENYSVQLRAILNEAPLVLGHLN